MMYHKPVLVAVNLLYYILSFVINDSEVNAQEPISVIQHHIHDICIEVHFYIK